jgi:hypothetical protein
MYMQRYRKISEKHGILVEMFCHSVERRCYAQTDGHSRKGLVAVSLNPVTIPVQHFFYARICSVLCANNFTQSYAMTDQSLEHSPVAPEQHTSLPATPAQLQEDTPWSPPLGPDMHKHKMCSDMVEAFSGGDTERASMLARLLLQHRASTFRVYAHLVSL